MATLNQFQLYSQKENTVTNNILSMFSMLYEINPKYYEETIESLTESSDRYRIIPKFQQQVGKGGVGVIDGMISMLSSKIIIETKLEDTDNINKLVKYTSRFGDAEVKILLHISKAKYSENEIKTIINSIEDKSIIFCSLTFEDIKAGLGELTKCYYFDIQLQKLNADFIDYCDKENLISRNNNILRVMACGGSFEINEKHKIYFDLASRGFRDFDYLGIYKNKSVQYIGTVENEIVADLDNEQINIHSCKHDSNADQEDRIRCAIKDANTLKGWDISKNHRFFLLNNFEETDFKKISPGGIFRVRYFTLEDILGTVPSSVNELANSIRNKTWE